MKQRMEPEILREKVRSQSYRWWGSSPISSDILLIGIQILVETLQISKVYWI
jgi:hypothetical protein